MALILVAPSCAAAVPANRSLALEAAVDGRPAGPSPALALAAGCWLEGEVEAVARLGLGSADGPSGRGATGAVTPEVGLRWSPDQGRWRPALAAAIGVRLPVAGRATTATALLQGGLERLVAPGWGLQATAGIRWLAGARAAGQGALAIRLYF